MPAQRLGTDPFLARRYDVAGVDAAGAAPLIRHVGLSADQRDGVRGDQELPLTHMGPPLRRSEGGCPIQTIGTVPLTADEIQQVSLFVDELHTEYEARRLSGFGQYVVRPHARSVQEADGTVVCRLFNCAGFVIEAYRAAGIDMLTTDESSLPGVSLPTLLVVFPDCAEILQHERGRRRYQLEGEGPWPVVLAGYILNALNREESDIRTEPYQPQTGDEFFPPHRSATRSRSSGPP